MWARRILRQHGAPVAVLAGVATILLSPLLFTGSVPYSTEFQARFRPHQAPLPTPGPTVQAMKPDPAAKPLDAYSLYWATNVHDDLNVSVWPAHAVSHAQIQDGELPLWNPHVLGGFPLAAGGMPAVYSPLNWPAHALPLSFGRSFALWLHLLLAGLLMYAFVVDLGRSRMAALAAGLVFMLNPLHAHWLYFVKVVPSNALIPLSLLLIRRIGLTDKPWRLVGLLAGTVGLQLLHANVSILMFTALIPAVGAFVLAPAERRARTVALSAGAAVVGVMAAGIALLPLVEVLAEGVRSSEKYTDTNFLSASWLLSLPFPRLFGHPGTNDYVGGFLFGRPFSTTYGVGAGTLVFALATLGAVVKKRWALGGVTAGILLGMVALSADGLRETVGGILPLLNTVDLTRALVLVYFGAALLVADGVGALESARGWKALAGVAGFAALGVVVLLVVGAGDGRLATHASGVALSLRTLLPLAVLVALAVAAWRKVPRLPLVATALLAVELLVLLWPGVPATSLDNVAPDTPELVALKAAVQARDDHPRIGGVVERDTFPPYHAGNLPPELGSLHGLEDIRGYPVVLPESMGTLLAFTAGRAYAAAVTLRDLTSPVYDLLGVRFVLAENAPAARFRQIAPGVWENPQAAPRAFFTRCAYPIPDQQARLQAITRADFKPMAAAVVAGPIPGIASCASDPGAAPVAVEYPSPSRATLKVSTRDPGVVVLADAWFPGWEVSVSGVPGEVLRVDQALRGVAVPPGDHTIEFAYRPASVRDAAWLTLVAWLAILALAIGRRPPLSNLTLLGLGALVVFAAFATRAGLPNDNDALYSSVARTLAEGGSWVGLAIGDEPFMDKPPLFFWVQGLIIAVINDSAAALLIFPLLAAVAGVVLTAHATRTVSGSEAAGILAGVVLICTPNYFEYARRAYMEIPVAVIGFLAWWLGLRLRWKWAGVAAGAAFMLKSVVGVLGIAALVFAHLGARRLPRGVWVAAGIALALVIPWHVAAYLYEPDVFLDFTLNLHFRDQIVNAQPWSTGGPLFYLESLLLHDTATGLMLVIGLPLGVALWRKDRNFALGALILAVVFQLALYTASATKKPFYILTVFPFVAMLGAWMVAEWRPRLVRVGYLVCGFLFVLQCGHLLVNDPTNQETPYVKPLAEVVRDKATPDQQLYALDIYLAAPQFYAERPSSYAVRDAEVQAVLSRIPYLRYGDKVVTWADDLLRGGHWVIAPVELGVGIVERLPGAKLVARNPALWLIQGPE